MEPVVVVGAGISGAACARELSAAGLPVRVVDRGRRVGGRLSSRRLVTGAGERPVDLGASYLTAGEDDFRGVVEDWVDRGLALSWTDTFAVLADGEEPTTKSGPVRYGAGGGLRSLVEDLLDRADVDVEEHEVAHVTGDDTGPQVDGIPAAAVVLAMPDAQAARLLGEAADLRAVAQRLTRESEPILALAAWWSERTWDDTVVAGRFDGAFVNGDDTLSWVADDGRRRGDGSPTLVAHSTPAFAAEHLTDAPAAGPAMLASLTRLLRIGAPPEGTFVQRWSLARPVGEREDPYLLTTGPAPLGVCGDGWGPTAKVETAWRSGRDLGRALVQRLG